MTRLEGELPVKSVLAREASKSLATQQPKAWLCTSPRMRVSSGNFSPGLSTRQAVVPYATACAISAMFCHATRETERGSGPRQG